MTPPVADFMARVQVGIAVGTFPVTLGLAAVVSPFDLGTAVAASMGTTISAFFLFTLFVPLAGLVISRMGIGKEVE